VSSPFLSCIYDCISVFTAQSHVLRKAVGSDNQLYLGLFLCFASESQVCVLKPVSELGIFKMIRQCTVYAPDVSSLFDGLCGLDKGEKMLKLR
jgi:hypothetical protein